MDGKNWEWEGVVLIPFIDAAALRAATASLDPAALSPEERARNALGPNRRFVWDGAVRHAEPTPMPRHFPALRACPVRCDEEGFRPFPPDAPHFLPRLAPGVSLGAAAPPGFPSLLSRPLRSAVLQKAHVEVFGRKSRRETLCLRFAHEVPIADTAVVADGALLECPGEGDDAAGAAGARGAAGADAGGRGRLGAEAMLRALRQSEEVAFQWPFWCPVRVEALTDGDDRAWLDAAGAVRSERLGVREREEHRRAGEAHHALWQGRRAVDVGPVRVMVTVRPVQGMAATPRGGTERVWAREAQAVCAQCITVLDPSPRRPQHAAPDARFQPADAPPVRERFAAGDAALLLGDGPDMGRLVSVVAVRGAAHVPSQPLHHPSPLHPEDRAPCWRVLRRAARGGVSHFTSLGSGGGCARAAAAAPLWSRRRGVWRAHRRAPARCAGRRRRARARPRVARRRRAVPRAAAADAALALQDHVVAHPRAPCGPAARPACPGSRPRAAGQVRAPRARGAPPRAPLRGRAVGVLPRVPRDAPRLPRRLSRARARARCPRALAGNGSKGSGPRRPAPRGRRRARGPRRVLRQGRRVARGAPRRLGRPAPGLRRGLRPLRGRRDRAGRARRTRAAQGAAGAAEGAAETRTVHAARLVLPIRPGCLAVCLPPGARDRAWRGARGRAAARRARRGWATVW